MPATTFPVALKNGILDNFCRGTAMSSFNALGSGAASLIAYSAAFGAASGPLMAAYSMRAADWGTPVAGTALFSATVTPNANGSAVWARMNMSAANLDGLITQSGNGGMLIVPSLTFVNGVPVVLTGTLRCPLNNGGTLRINQAMANAILRLMISGTTMNGIGVTSGGTPVLSIYNGVQPATADTPVTTQTLLSNSHNIPNGTTWSVASGGASALTSALTSAGIALASGTATWFRWSKGAYVMDGTVGTTGADMTLASTTFTSGATPPAVSGCTVTLP